MRPTALVIAVVLLTVGPARAQGTVLVPPVDAPIVSYFEAPGSPYGPGHRGVDYGVPEGSDVRASAAGTVLFAGSVAGDPAVTIDHGGGLHTTYSVLADIDVSEGDAVRSGTIIGSVGTSHGTGDQGLHFGVKLDGAYVDPEDLLIALDPSDAIRLVPVERRPLSVIGIHASMPTDLPLTQECSQRYDLQRA
ncbi:MAG: murein hydrolase activator EnvC family protein, partial [Actinomycetota bacterium]